MTGNTPFAAEASNQSNEWVEVACSVMHSEAEAIRKAAGRQDGRLGRAVEIILACKGKVVLAGVGKSGLIARKIAATLTSTGTPAIFLHPTDAIHGDMGICTPGDVMIFISKSGGTAELLKLSPLIRSRGLGSIGVLGNLNCPMAAMFDAVLDACVECEADPLNFVPTSSTTVALALGDALAVAVMQARKFGHQDFAQFHPAGQLGRSLLLQVNEVMHPVEGVALVHPATRLRDVIIAMTRFPLGAAFVVSEEQRDFLGLITDGDLRRALLKHEDIRDLLASDLMTRSPVCVPHEASLREAASIMENRDSQISVLPVMGDSCNKCVGLLRIHDIYDHGRG